MEKIQATQENLSEELYAFRGEMAEIKRQEEKREEGGTAHFLHMEFNPEELLSEDMEIYKKILGGTLTWEEWDEYDTKIIDPETGRRREGVPDSRYVFKAFAGNKASGVLAFKERAPRNDQ